MASYNSSFTPPLYSCSYAPGILALVSNTPSVDLSCKTGTCGYDPNVHATVAIADPSLAPFGVAVQTVLTGRYGLTPPLSSNSLVHEYANITATFDAVIAQTDPVGFVALAAICSNGSNPTSGTSALEYFPIESSPIPSVLINNYKPITQGGIAIRNDRTAAQDAELEAFVAFLTDFTTSPAPDSSMITTLNGARQHGRHLHAGRAGSPRVSRWRRGGHGGRECPRGTTLRFFPLLRVEGVVLR